MSAHVLLNLLNKLRKSYFWRENVKSFAICMTLKASFLNVSRKSVNHLEINCIQNVNLGRYIVGYMGGYLALWRRTSGGIQRDFRPYIQRYTSLNENFEYGYPHSNELLQF